MKPIFKRDEYVKLVSLTYYEQPQDMEAARKDVRNYVQRVRRMYKSAKTAVKCSCVTRQGRSGLIYHYVVISDSACGKKGMPECRKEICDRR